MILYKDPRQQEMFDGLVALGKPDELKDHKIWGIVGSAFEMGYNGTRRPHWLVRGSDAWVAYYAGREAKRREGLNNSK